MNVQTEHLENHTARLTVELDPPRLEKAMRQTARRIGRKVRVKGFRPGKVPYDVIVSMYGREAVLQETLEAIGNDVYAEALDAAEITPYAPGSLDKIEDGGLRLVFIVPKAPEANLGDHRAVRVEFEPPEVTDQMVQDSLENMREKQALIEEVERPAKMGDQLHLSYIEVTVVTGEQVAEEFGEDDSEADAPGDDAAAEADETGEADDTPDAADSEAEAEAEAASEGEAEATADDQAPGETRADEAGEEDEEDDNVIFHHHGLDRVLREDENDLFPGFSANLVGLSPGDDAVFLLELPDDWDDEELAGKTLRCEVSVERVSARHVPEWSDDLAKRLTDGQHETLLDLRVEVRKQLQQQADDYAQQQISRLALDQIVEGAELSYPPDLIEAYLDDIMDEHDRNARQRGFTLRDYLAIRNQTIEELRDEFREVAIVRARRDLVLRELIRVEEITATEEDVDAELDRLAGQMGGDEQAARFRQILDTEDTREGIRNQLIARQAFDLLVAIAQGQDPNAAGEEPDAPAADAAESEESSADADAPAEAVAEDAPAEDVPADDGADDEAEGGESDGEPADEIEMPDTAEAVAEAETEADEADADAPTDD